MVVVMAAENERTTEPPTCSGCGIEMEFRGAGTTRTVPIVGQEIEFRQYSCPECGQGARLERREHEEAWSRPTL